MGVIETNIDQTLVYSLHRLLNCEIGGLDCRVIITEYIIHLFCSFRSTFEHNNVVAPQDIN